MIRSTLFISLVFILGAALSRLLPHPANFTPVLAISLFSGAYLSSRWVAAIIPVAAVFLSDIFIGFHNLMLPIYLLLALGSVAGRGLANGSASRITFVTLAGSSVFFIVTNFLVWISSGMYTLDLPGLIQCYTLAIPFFQNQVAGDLIYSGVLFGSMHYLISRRWISQTGHIA
jgi:hypothetical protein